MRCKTIIFLTDFAPLHASSAFFLSGTMFPRLKPPSAVRTALARQSSMRSRSEFALKPAKTTLCGAPMRAQASMAMAASGVCGM